MWRRNLWYQAFSNAHTYQSCTNLEQNQQGWTRNCGCYQHYLLHLTVECSHVAPDSQLCTSVIHFCKDKRQMWKGFIFSKCVVILHISLAFNFIYFRRKFNGWKTKLHNRYHIPLSLVLCFFGFPSVQIICGWSQYWSLDISWAWTYFCIFNYHNKPLFLSCFCATIHYNILSTILVLVQTHYKPCYQK